MKQISKTEVFYHDRLVGTIAMAGNHKAVFSYADAWLNNGFSISPFSLPLKEGIFIPSKPYFDGLFGVFADSLPDAWGRLLVDRLLQKNGVDISKVTALDRLSIVGDLGMGALTYAPAKYLAEKYAEVDLDRISEECAKLLKFQDSGDLDMLYHLGGSSGGARPKITINIDDDLWLVKFPAHIDSKDTGRMEYEYSLCAKKCGIIMPDTRLFSSAACPGYFGIKRFDIENGERIHMLTASALLEADFESPCLDYMDLFKLTRIICRNNHTDIKQLYLRMCFNVFAHNRDDHAKNFTYLYNEKEDCFHLSPAYDITYSSTYFGEHTTSVLGNGKNPGKEELIKAGTASGIEKTFCEASAETIRQIVNEDLSKWIKPE